MSASNLTPKQEKFCLEIAKGACYSDAYRKAYNAENMSEKTIYKKASLIAKRGDVRGRIEQLKAEFVEDIKYTREDSFKKLCEYQKMALARMSKEGNPIPDLNNAIKAEALILKLFGLETETKNLNIKGSDAFENFYRSICEQKDYNK